MTITKRSVFLPQQLPRYMLFIQNNDVIFWKCLDLRKILVKIIVETIKTE